VQVDQGLSCAVRPALRLSQADRQEALVRAEQRRMAIERANKVLFDATDDVKALHSKLLLSEVRHIGFLIC
jgi:hypothetical protein